MEGTVRAGEILCKLGKNTPQNALRMYRKKSCYILQDDRLDPLFTVNELMNFAADFKLGNMITKKLKNSIVSSIYIRNVIYFSLCIVLTIPIYI